MKPPSPSLLSILSSTGQSKPRHSLFTSLSLCFLSASLSSAGGIGGGGLYIPILALTLGLDLKTASTFSSFMVTGASVANVFCSFVGDRKSADFDIVLLSQPCMLLGVSVGVVCNLILPEWTITAMFAVFLGWSTVKTFRIGVVYWRMESEEEGRKNGGRIGESLLEGEGKREDDCSRGVPWRKIGGLVVVWVAFSVIYLVRGGKNGQSIVHIKRCGIGYWVISLAQIPLAVAITAWVLHTQKRQNDQNFSHQELSTFSKQHIFPLMAIVAGFVGGLFGIGGGTLISPLLLQLGVPPEVTGATCAFIVFFSSTMSAFQYLLLGVSHADTAAVFALTCFVGSLIGLVAVQNAIKKHGRASLIIFSVGTVMALSTLLLTGFGAVNVWKDYIAGNYMGMKLPC